MGNIHEPKCKKCRRIGEKLFLKGERCSSTKCAMVKRNYPPGFHGQKGKKRASDYGAQLNEKQKIRNTYNLMEKQFKLTFDNAKKLSGNVGENFISLLETRLDNVIFRAGFASSRPMARQLVGHGLFTLNDKKIDIPSVQVKTGDVIKIKDNKKNSPLFKDLAERLKKYDVPGWLNVESKDVIAVKILHKPDLKDVMRNLNVHVVVEYYSR
ncbi:30S ribosomal protein S4 [Candidatus Parcubacteria bacterium]|nr:30S ribosomal protein S4 [Patescibacteria group bacterium]MBU4309442.1 30S ribosomal protein S4 [Patescibacteria group bacterium]MBU4432243.1 30S ribosomal protein S4 [Patescibacteria group bacterium]MBU4577803.1 30S ribosomal protein S4 [Patescibacteria group bacterium]MCG2696796.1 30S ribosomal protein S4 [Candidatus Parcubacteria bacterium]